ncbi:bifunctional DNA primase/polymerase [Streptomyces sp. NPDC002746]
MAGTRPDRSRAHRATPADTEPHYPIKRSRGRRTDGRASADVSKPSLVSTDHPPRQTLKSVALAAAARGWRVFPLRPGTTTPAVQNWQQKATSDPEKSTPPETTGRTTSASLPARPASSSST